MLINWNEENAKWSVLHTSTWWANWLLQIDTYFADEMLAMEQEIKMKEANEIVKESDPNEKEDEKENTQPGTSLDLHL